MSTTTRKFKTVITDTGAKKLAQAAAPDGKPVRLTHMAVGDGGGTLPTPDSKQTRLVHEVWRHTVNRVILDATHQNRIIAELVIPPETGGFWIREIGVFDEHGDLIAVGNTAESYKPAVAEGSGRAQTFRTILTVSSTATVALTVDNTMVMATVDYVDDKLKEHEQSRRHPDASLTAKGFVQLSSATNSVSETQAATPKAVKAAYDLANGKYTAQDASTTRKGLVQLSSATNSTSETQAATPKAVKAAYDLANAKYTAQDATTAQKGIVQLSSATNSTSETLAATSKAVKAVMDETNKKAPLNSPALTGTPTTPTARQGTNNTQIASTAFVMAAIAALVDSSPDALNTLNELAAALGNDPNFATTMTNALAGKQPKDATLTALAGLATAADRFPYFTGNDVASLATLTKVGRDILAKSTVAAVIEYLGLRELGTSGEKIPLLSTANTWTNRQTLSGGLSGELSGNAATATKLKTARKIAGVGFDGSSDISISAKNVNAFALRQTGNTVNGDTSVGWNWDSGAYNALIGGASALILHFNINAGSCPAVQFRVNYKNGGISYRSARDGYGFELGWSDFYTTTRKPSAGDVGAYTQAECNSRFITGIRLGGLSSVQTWNGPGWSDRSGYVVTGSVNGNRDELIDTTQARPIQYCINGTWYNAGSI
ncbi:MULTISPECIES: tail fiber protein [Escherichia]|uniref:Phage tail protein n=2 Tax=Enterobacteriaceae TaxID=543 RepID=A0A736KCH1_SALTH|nr:MULTISPECIES: tail fiber protein [Escherichia]EAA3278765.1 phage tail protein [Salmonella enterica subsp. enterica serovar Telelkebir]EBZ1996875.1 phage tail protein [Salmonella enterica subsp. enterica serovar Grumpensis]EKM2168489.1 tail fiber protein [Escherichia coli O45]EKR1915947.1 tail fiber protein [Salmonella enterica subsp. enterica serovar Thompson]ELE2498310.1 tail fiber protein [Salmonella enterica]EMA9472157.1 tail fiber protein [Escherichia coli O145]